MLAVVRALWGREILTFVRDRSRVAGALGQPVAFWLVLGLGFGGTFRLPGATGDGVSYLAFLFPGMVALVLLFTAIFSTISVVEDRQRGLLQAVLVAPVSRTALVLGQLAGGVTLALAQAALFLLAAPLVGLVPTPAGAAAAALAALALAVAFTALGLVMAWRVQTTRGFHGLMNLLLLPLWGLSGAFFPLEGAPAALRALMLANPATYGVAALRQGLMGAAVSPAPPLPLGANLAIAGAFAVALVALAVATVRRPLYGS